MFSSSFYSKFDQEYFQLLKKLEEDLKVDDSYDQQEILLNEFARNYMMPKELWEVRFK